MKTFMDDLEEAYRTIVTTQTFNPQFSNLQEALGSAYEALEEQAYQEHLEQGGDDGDYEPISQDLTVEEIALKLRGSWHLSDAIQLELCGVF